MGSPILNLVESMNDAKRLMEIHKDIGGSKSGRRYGLDVLNQSSVIFLSSAWESFIEDVVTQSIDHIIDKAPNHNILPNKLLKMAAESLKADPHDLRIWDIAGDGWKSVIKAYRNDLIHKEISTFNTPKPDNINTLIKKILDIEKITDKWNWRGMTNQNAYQKLKDFIETRGAIAHRGNLNVSITKAYVTDHRKFITRIAVRTSNILRDRTNHLVGSFPWNPARFGTFT